TADSSTLFARIAHENWAILLDSGKPEDPHGRYDIIVGRPFMTVVAQDGRVTVCRNGQEVSSATQDPFAVLKTLLADYMSPSVDLPFTGGAVGYFGYDLGRSLEL